MALLVAIPLLLAGIAGVVSNTALSSALYYAAVVSLAVMLVESMLEIHGYRQEKTETAEGVLQQKAALEVLTDRVSRQEEELETATEDRRLAGLMYFVGETAPTVAELSLRDPHILDGWLDLVASRVQKATGTGYAAIVLLQEAVDWSESEGDFVGHYAVACGGGSAEFHLSPGTQLLASDTVPNVLIEQAGAGSVYFSEFSFNEEPYWLCALLSTSASHGCLQILTRAMVAPVLVTLDALQREKYKEPVDRGIDS